jgi:ParB family chromosome partitioning protein
LLPPPGASRRIGSQPSFQAEGDPANNGEGAPRGHDLKQWLFGTDQLATGAALFPLEHYKGDIITDLFGDLSFFADADALGPAERCRLQASRRTWRARAGR